MLGQSHPLNPCPAALAWGAQIQPLPHAPAPTVSRQPLPHCLRTRLLLPQPSLRAREQTQRGKGRHRNPGRALITAGVGGEPAAKELREPGLIALQEPVLPHLGG